MYDAVYLYAIALNDTLSEGGSKRDGIRIAKKMYNRVFEGTVCRVWIETTVDPLFRGHHRRIGKWPLNRGWPLKRGSGGNRKGGQRYKIVKDYTVEPLIKRPLNKHPKQCFRIVLHLY